MIPASDVKSMGDEALRGEVRAWLAANWKNDLPPAQQWVASEPQKAFPPFRRRDQRHERKDTNGLAS